VQEYFLHGTSKSQSITVAQDVSPMKPKSAKSPPASPPQFGERATLIRASVGTALACVGFTSCHRIAFLTDLRFLATAFFRVFAAFFLVAGFMADFLT
jgi:hypothetical protein